MPFSTNLAYASWAGRIANSVALVLATCLLKTEICHFRRSVSKHLTRLTVFEFITLISTAFITLQSITMFIPFLCEYTTNAVPIFTSLQRGGLGFYQIARLQTCFCSTQKHLANYGYKRYSYAVLYVVGILVFGAAMIVSPLAFPVEAVENYGCSYGPIRYRWSFIVLALCAIIYYLWDWTILAMYIYKMMQVKHHIKTQKDVNNSQLDMKKRNVALKQLQVTLTKVTVLTVCYELSALILILPVIVLNLYFFTVPQVILQSVDRMLAAIIVFLMADHNTKYYLCITQMCCTSSTDSDSDSGDSEMAGNTSQKKKNGDLNVQIVDVVLPNQSRSKTTVATDTTDPSEAAAPLPPLILVQSVTKDIDSGSVPRFCRSHRSYLANN